MLVKCHECSKEMSSEAKACPQCGVANPKHWGAGRMIATGIAVLFFGFIAFVAIGLVLAPDVPPEVRAAKAHDRDTIALCRKEQDDELKELATRRFIRAACDKMEADFRTKYGVAP